MQKVSEIKNIENDKLACKALEESVESLRATHIQNKQNGQVDNAIQKEYDKNLIEYIKPALTARFYKCVAQEFSQGEKENYNRVWINAIKEMSPESIYEAGVLLPYKAMLFDYYYGENIVKKIEAMENKIISFQGQNLIKVTNGSLINLELTEIQGSTLIFEGFDYCEALADNFNILVTDEKGNAFEPTYEDWYRRDRFNFVGEIFCKAKKFRFEIPLGKVKKIKFVVTDGKNRVVILPVFGNFSKFNNRASGAYYVQGGFIVSLVAKARFQIEKYSKGKVLKKEMKYAFRLVTKLRYRVLIMRFLYFAGKMFSRKPVWIFRDNEKRAKDSGIVMFQRFKEYKNHKKYKAYFILDKKSEDYPVAKKHGKVIQPHTLKYKVKSLRAEVLFDTRGSINPKYILGRDAIYLRDLCKWNYVWMIHGVMTRNESTWTGKFDINAKIYATCGKRECEAVMDPANGYGYSNGEAQITGLPRHDALTHDKTKNILFMPTWRKEYAGELIPGTSDRKYVPNFKESEYYKFYNKLINDERLLKAMRENGYDGDFYLHPSFMKQWEDFDGNDCIRIANKPADTNKATSKCSLMITDFSSVAFDAAYLGTPVVYTQYDIDTFGERHTGKDGYYEYEKDGFGKVCVEYDDAVNEIIRYIENDCVMEDIYKKRVDDFFVYKDGQSSLRVFEAVDKLLNK